MKKITVELAEKSYEIRVGSSILAETGAWLKEKSFSGKAVIITDNNVGKHYSAPLHKSLAESGFAVTELTVPAGEASKTLETAGSLYDQLADAYADRSTLIIALGGGVIGDLAGFVAATYMRGVGYIQVPTSLLAMVDSSIGGKTAVDRGKMKNIVGAFYQPRMVISDIDTLRTLPREELSNGMAEAIKTAAIGDSKIFKYLEDNIMAVMGLDADILEKIVLDNALLKAKVVGKDEKESGERIILNYGHTIGHAVEAVSGFNLKHGQAVAIGMVVENTIACRKRLLSENEAFRIKKVIELAGLPAGLPDFSNGEKDRVLELIKHDKKVFNNKVRFVLLKGIGHPIVAEDIETWLIKEVLHGRTA